MERGDDGRNANDAADDFAFHEDPVKHHVRRSGWLPFCRDRAAAIGNAPGKQKRRMRYFSFCAATAIDVLMLDVEKILRPSKRTGFDNVCFFNHTPEAVLDTQLSIPGAKGFPGQFTELVNLFDPREEEAINAESFEEEVRNLSDNFEERQKQNLRGLRRQLIDEFPFDVINLDLERYPFKPKEVLPGDLMRAIAKMLAWQKRPLTLPNGNRTSISEFTLMYTAQVGPANLSDDYLAMLRQNLQNNLDRDPELGPILTRRMGIANPLLLQENDFNTFFALATPKVLLQLLWDEDWVVAPERGVQIFMGSSRISVKSDR